MRVVRHRWVWLCLFVLTALGPPAAAWAQELFAPINTTDVFHRRLVDEIYRGRFERIARIDTDRFIPASDELYAAQHLLIAATTAFSDQCQHKLSPNKRELKFLLITYEQRTTVLQQGLMSIPIDSSTRETGRKVISTGVFADEPFYSLYQTISDAGGMNGMVKFFRELARGNNSMDAAAAVMGEMLRNHVDTHKMFARHGCDSTQVATYMANLANYVRNRQPARREPTFMHYCSARVSAFLPGVDRSRCPCLHGALRKNLHQNLYFELEDQFTEENFLSAVVARVDLHKEIAACTR